METIVLALAAAFAVAVSAYAHYRIPFHTQGKWNQLFLRLALLAASTGLGMLSAAEYVGIRSVLGFIAAFGVVHFPAAVILFIKRQRGVTR
ncbi:MAG: hypothetical protein LPJ87_07755 [Zoogloeaceae bacterium]|nr:hypothetical protein [Zoogloeaceae bacterium]